MKDASKVACCLTLFTLATSQLAGAQSLPPRVVEANASAALASRAEADRLPHYEIVQVETDKALARLVISRAIWVNRALGRLSSCEGRVGLPDANIATNVTIVCKDDFLKLSSRVPNIERRTFATGTTQGPSQQGIPVSVLWSVDQASGNVAFCALSLFNLADGQICAATQP